MNPRSNDPAGLAWREAVRDQAKAEVYDEMFRNAVEAEKTRIRARQQSWWTRLINRLFK